MEWRVHPSVVPNLDFAQFLFAVALCSSMNVSKVEPALVDGLAGLTVLQRASELSQSWIDDPTGQGTRFKVTTHVLLLDNQWLKHEIVNPSHAIAK